MLAVEPKLNQYSEFELNDYSDAVAQSDIVVFLVSYKEFLTVSLDEKVVLDFCGATAQ